MFESAIVVSEQIARQLLRALRGDRSQLAFSRRVGFRTSVAASWEAGRRMPDAATFFHAVERVGVALPEAMARFHPRAAELWDAAAPAAWLSALVGATTQRALAERAGLSRQQVGRFLRGDALPRLPGLIALVEAATGRVEDWVACLVDPDQVPAIADLMARKARAEALLVERPEAAGVLVLRSVLPSGSDRATFIGARLGLSIEDAGRLLAELDALDAQGLSLRWPDAPEPRARARRHWSSFADRRLDTPGPEDRFSFNLAAVSREDAARVLDLQTDYFRALRSLVAASQSSEVALLVTMHSLTLGP